MDLQRTPCKPLMSILDLGKLLLQYSRDGDVEKVNELIVKGAPFNADWLGMTPLHYAAKNSNYIICDMLLRGGINKDAKTKVDRTALHFAVYEGNKSIVELLLVKNVDINIRDILRMTALHWAIEKHHSDIAKLLIIHGADVTVTSKFGKSPISIATQTGQTDLLEDIEKACWNQKNNETCDIQQHQMEISKAVSSIAFDTLPDTLNINFPENELHKNTSYSSQVKSIGALHDAKPVNVWELHKADSSQVPKKFEESALEILKHHGITMLPQEDSQNILSTALQGGRKLVVSEAGKLILNETYQSSEIETLFSSDRISTPFNKSEATSKFEAINRSISSRLKGISSSKNKNVKIISMDIFKRMYAHDTGNSFRKPFNGSSKNYGATGTKLVKLNDVPCGKAVISKAATIRKQGQQPINCTRVTLPKEENEQLPINIIEVCSESDSDNDIGCYSGVPNLSIPEICRKLVSLEEQIKHLQQQLEFMQQRNEKTSHTSD